MLTTNKFKYFSLAAVFGAWGCSPNQQVTNNTVIYDDLYGRPSETIAATGAPSKKVAESKEFSNPDFAVATDEINAANGVSNEDYYDENYVTARNYKWDKSAFNGYDIGYNDGYSNAVRNTAFSPFNSFGSMYPMGGFGMSFGMGMGMGSSFRFGYNPFMWNSFNNPYMYGGFNSPFMYNGFYDYGYAGMWGDPFYGGMYGGGMYGGGWGSPFNRYYGYPTVIVNNYEGARGRTYGPRGSSVATRRNETLRPSNSSYVSSGRSSATTTRRSNGDYSTRSSRASASTGDTYYARPRNTDAFYSDRATRSSNSAGVNTRSTRNSVATENNSGYYSRPRSTVPATGNSGTRSTGTYQAPSRSYNSNSTNNSFNRSSNNTYQAPTRSYSTESRSSNSNSAPSRSYSAPSSSGGSSSGGGASRSSRGSR